MTVTFEEARKQLNSGRRMSPGEYRFLASLVVQSGVVVDIGSWMGFSARVLAEALRRKNFEGFVLSIDPHTLEYAGKHREAVEAVGLTSTLPFLRVNLKEWGIQNLVIAIAGKSQEVVRSLPQFEVSLLVIDGSHRYAEVREDFELWYPRVARDGILCFHDYQHIAGPTRVVDSLVRPECEEIGRVGWLIAFRRR